MKELSIDIEDYSGTSIECGRHKRHADKDFEIVCLAYKVDDLPTVKVSLKTGEKVPSWFLPALVDPTIIKNAFNAAYELSALSTHFKIKLYPEQWRCTMVRAASMGLPMSLDGVGAALNLKDQKDKKGKALISYFCGPVEPMPKNNFRIRNLPENSPQDWEDFVNYCARDVDVEYATKKKLSIFPFDEREQRLWVMDQKINNRGFLMDRELITNAVKMHRQYKNQLIDEARQLTGLSNPNSLKQLKTWIGNPNMSLTADDVKRLIGTTNDVVLMRVLEIRKETGKSSVDKYVSMLRSMTPDNIVRGAIQHYGAGTGRGAGRLFQPHNLPRNEEHFDLDFARYLVKTNNQLALSNYFGSVIHPLSQLCRTAIVPAPGKLVIASDFSQIESRANAAMAGERWKIAAFKAGTDIYIAGASMMFGVPIDRISKDGDERQQGKIAELACGYQGGPSAIFRSWPKHIPPPTQQRAQEIVDRWRAANPCIKNFWWNVNKAAIQAVRDGGRIPVAGCLFYVYHGILFCELPNGRALAYPRPRLAQNQWGGDCVVVHGIHPTTRQWTEIWLYGGLLVENIIQAMCRDVLYDKMVTLDKLGYDIFGHVHDEVMIEGTEDLIPKVTRIMSEPIPWFKELPLAAVTKGLKYYKKA